MFAEYGSMERGAARLILQPTNTGDFLIVNLATSSATPTILRGNED